MAFFSWSRWFRSLLRPQVKPIQKRRSRLRVEELESRLAPANFFTWVGGGADTNWTTLANWQNNVAPPSQGGVNDNLIFQGANSASNNNLNNAVFGNIQFASPNFNLTGNALTLDGGITVNANQGSEVVNLAGISLGSANESFQVGSSSTLSIGTVASTG
jgi:fibronectin-binding autotransporter adhesin